MLSLPFPLFDASSIPRLQRTVAACLSEVDTEPPSDPFIPAGCPFTIHNPFTSRSQCKVLSEVITSPQALRTVLSDFSARRGWQPLVSVHPQPDSASVHLVPAAADQALASVVLRSGSTLNALCLTRQWQGNPYRRIVLHGRHGRLREPYSVSRGMGGAVTFRDGDCLLADMGPFGPPPPTPATSSGARVGAFALVLPVLSGLSGGRSGLWLAFLLFTRSVSVQILPPAPDGVSAARYSVGHYPWREPHERQSLQLVCHDRTCRISMLCPWRGPQGIFQVPPQVALQDVWAHYSEPGRSQDLMPVWPNPSADRLWFVPRAHIAGSLVCIVVQHRGSCRALVVPARLHSSRLAQVVQYMTGWVVSQVRIPLGLQAISAQSADGTCLFRDGDVLDALSHADGSGCHIVHDSPILSVMSYGRGLLTCGAQPCETMVPASAATAVGVHWRRCMLGAFSHVLLGGVPV